MGSEDWARIRTSTPNWASWATTHRPESGLSENLVDERGFEPPASSLRTRKNLRPKTRYCNHLAFRRGSQLGYLGYQVNGSFNPSLACEYQHARRRQVGSGQTKTLLSATELSRFAIQPSALRRELKVNRDGICLNWLAVHCRWLISPLKDRILCSFSKGGVLG